MATRQSQKEPAHLSVVAAQIVNAVEEEPRFGELVSCIVDQMLVTYGADAVALYTFDAAQSHIVLLKQRGFPDEFVHHLSQLSLNSQTLAGSAAARGEVQVAEIPHSGAGTHTSVEQRLCKGFSALIAAPLRSRGQTVGVLTLAARHPGRFGAADVPTIEFIAHAIAAAILNARAFEAERRMSRAMQAVDEATLAISSEFEPRRVLQAIVDRAREVTGAQYAALGIGTDPDKQFAPWVFSGLTEEHARAIGHYPRPRGLLGAVPAAGTTIRVPDMSRDPRRCGFPSHHPPMRSFLGVPIQSRGESIGNLYLTDKIGADEFSVEDERAASTLAAHAAIAIQHSRLYEQAQHERNRLRAVLEGSPLGIIFVESATGRVYANRAAEELFGHSIDPEAGRDQYRAQLTFPDGTTLSEDGLPSSRAMRGEPVVGSELVLRRPDGPEVPVMANAAPITDTQGQITGAVVLWQDISPLKLEQLREEFISMVAHELRTPLSVITGYADYLSRGQHAETERRAVESIRVSAKRLDRLVRDLLDASRIEARRLQLEKRTLCIDTLVRDLVERLKEVFADHPVRVALHGKLPAVEADPARVEQVLTNLLTNAAKYSSPRSEIFVDVSKRPEEVLVSVTNEGTGILPEEMPRLFSRFYRTRSAAQGQASGLGLGLYIARSLVESHGGRIWANSKPGEGATFSFALPLCGDRSLEVCNE